jgi:hypothetical protein
MVTKLNKNLIIESSYTNISCNGIQNVDGKSYGFSCGKEKKSDKVFIYTHRSRSSSYPNLEKIPISVKKFIDSTG